MNKDFNVKLSLLIYTYLSQESKIPRFSNAIIVTVKNFEQHALHNFNER